MAKKAKPAEEPTETLNLTSKKTLNDLLKSGRITKQNLS